jgi:hypothetical protein
LLWVEREGSRAEKFVVRAGGKVGKLLNCSREGQVRLLYSYRMCVGNERAIYPKHSLECGYPL